MIETLSFHRYWDRAGKIHYFASEIKEAVEEALLDAEVEFLHEWSPVFGADMQKEHLEAYEDAAKIALTTPCPKVEPHVNELSALSHAIADAIRARAAECKETPASSHNDGPDVKDRAADGK